MDSVGEHPLVGMLVWDVGVHSPASVGGMGWVAVSGMGVRAWIEWR